MDHDNKTPAQKALDKVYPETKKLVQQGELSRVGALEICLKHIRAAGGVPNRKFYAALKAAKALDAALAQPQPPVESTEYIIVAPNGKEHRVFVAKGGDIFKVAKEHSIEIQSFRKA